MTEDQETTLAWINNQWGVARWEHEDDEVRVELDDGDEAVIYEDGRAVWTYGAFKGQEVTP